MVGYVSGLGTDLRVREILISRFGDRSEKEKKGKKIFSGTERERERRIKKLIYKTTIMVYIYVVTAVIMYFYISLHGLVG